jgi:ABC-2 type transport system ATP-binding protein
MRGGVNRLINIVECVRQSEGPAIVAGELTKTFPVPVRRPGAWGAVRSLIAPEHELRTAVDRVTFAVAPGELVALLGPNGAGKSTTIKMLTGILIPSSGELRVDGRVPYRDRAANAYAVGAVFGQRSQLWWDLPARASFTILRDIFEIDDADFRSRLGELDGLLGLSEFWRTPVRHLSLGQRVRCDLAAALLHDPAIVFLDEPTIGMDVVVKEQVRDFLRHQVERRGRTVLLTTHDMTEVGRLAERVLLINHGRLAFDGPLAELRTRYGGGWRVRVTFAEPVGAVAVPGAAVVERGTLSCVLAPDGESALSRRELLRALVERYPVADIAIDEGDLEDVMRAAYRERAHHPVAADT